MLKITQLPRSVFFYHLKPKIDKNAGLRLKIIVIKQKNTEYGYRRVSALLNGINDKRIQRLMKEMDLQVKPTRAKRYTSYLGEVGKIAPNLLERDFTANQPNEKWLTDVTEIKADDGNKLYLSPILDCFNNEIIAMETSRSPNFKQVQNMLLQAVKKLQKNAKPILHSDQGWQYQMVVYRNILVTHGIRQSMSCKGNCLDNAKMESFFGRLKVECIHGRRFAPVDEIEQTVKDYVRYYNEKRIQIKLKGLSTIQYRKQPLNF